MMEPNQRFSILTFPQFFDGNVLDVNIVVLPRNQNPLVSAIDGEAALAGAAAFADAKLSFVARIVSGLSGLPGLSTALAPLALPTVPPGQARPLFEALAHQFSIVNPDAPNTNANLSTGVPEDQRAPAAVALERTVKKYLPLSYRSAFNFVAPRTPNAVTDDAYHCAMRNAAPVAGFKTSSSQISWGQVFANAMRQPQLAMALGMIYKTHITLDASHFAKGGWLYVDLAADSDYRAQMDTDPTFIRRYATRMPILEPGKPRQTYGAIQFPVLPSAPSGNYDELFIEAADFDDGFAKVVHATQPVSNSLLLEESDGFHPTADVGIRLGWDDEQILLWYIRQLGEHQPGSGERIDAPIGSFGYSIDARQVAPVAGPWGCLNQVRSKAPLAVVDPVTNGAITLGDFTDKDLPYQVYPSQIDGDSNKCYWLPMYFANWTGKSMVLPDEAGAALFKHDEARANTDINVGAPPANQLNRIYEASGLTTELRYGSSYEFRIRLGDLSGGGPSLQRTPQDEVPSQTAGCLFKRFVSPDTVRIEGLPVNTDTLFAGDELTLRRPLLGYPAVVFTGRYADPIPLLQAVSDLRARKEDEVFDKVFGIPDPNVECVEITVEVQTLKMDNLQSVSGRESYIAYYVTKRMFPTDSAVFDDVLTVPIEYRDCKVLKFGEPGDLGDLGVTQAQLDVLPQLVLPRARSIRLTLRAVCEEKPAYYGLENEKDRAFDTRYGRTIKFELRADPLADEANLFTAASRVRGIYLQPDPPPLFDGNRDSRLIGKDVEKQPDMIQRLAQELWVECRQGLTLVARKGQRVQFGCSQRVRHTLSPDNGSITFASKGDLTNHWLCCIVLDLQRDWTWDGLEDRSLTIRRRKRFRDDDLATETDEEEVGDIEIKRTAPFTALLAPDRSHTTLIFIDAVEPANARRQPSPNGSQTRFPDLIELGYTVAAVYRNPLGAATDADLELSLTLPITTPPAQVPRILSAGIALSPYLSRDNYARTEARRRFLWLEFAEPVRDPQDSYFARVLGNAPDQLISNNHPELLVAPEDPPLPIDAEPIRIVSFNQSNDDAGLEAMQPMERSNGPGEDAGRFYLLPLPESLHPESPEMFGFFTYEIRIGHHRYSDTKARHATGDAVWTTAQGRFGRPLKVPGIQHPAPTLTCAVDRDEAKLYVTAPYAVAVHKGRNVTADPPRTEIWALLYAQVTQADRRAYRNILLDDRVLAVDTRVEHDRALPWALAYTPAQRTRLKLTAIRNFRDELSYANFRNHFRLADTQAIDKGATKLGTAIWTEEEIGQLLDLYGLPRKASLSVLCVEILPHVTDVFDHVNALRTQGVRDRMRRMLGDSWLEAERRIAQRLAGRAADDTPTDPDADRPLNDALGNYRILRTSPLVKVPFVC